MLLLRASHYHSNHEQTGGAIDKTAGETSEQCYNGGAVRRVRREGELVLIWVGTSVRMFGAAPPDDGK